MGKQGESAVSCRIERKRAHDREAQRASRAKTKAYIAHLEKTVADLSSNSGDNRTNYLSQHASKQAEEIESLQGLVNKIRSLVHDNTKSITGHSAPALPAPANSLEGHSPESADSAEPYYLGAGDHSPPGEDPWQARPSAPSAPTKPTPRNLVLWGENLMCDDNDERTYFASLNRVLSKLEQVPDNLSAIDEDQDIVVRAMLHGWDECERMHHFDIVWRFIRAYDEGLWWRGGWTERIAIIWQVRMFLLYRINPKNQPKREIQPFMIPTPLQRSDRHREIIADYFIWPLVRDHIIDEGFQHATGRNVIIFAKSFRFNWPYERRDIYMKNNSTGQYRLSDGFLKSHNNLSNYGILHNRLFPPVYRHPSIARQSSGSKEDVAAEQAADQHLESTRASCPFAEAARRATSMVGDVTPPSVLAMDIPNAIDWPQPFDLDITNDPKFAPFALDPFSLAHEGSLMQWPVL